MSLTDHKATFILWTRRNVILFLAVIGLVLAIMLGNTAILLFAAVMTAMLMSAAWLARAGAEGLTVQRSHPERLFEREELPIRYTFRKAGRIPATLVEVRDVIPIGEKLQYQTILSERVGEGEAVMLDTRVECVRGRGAFRLGPLDLTMRDPAGLIRAPESGRVPVVTPVLVCPRGHNVEGLDLLGEGVLRAMGLQTRRHAGESGEFVGLRDYRPGDALRRIHWRSSLRHNRLLVREFLEDVTSEIAIFVDVRRLSRFGTGEHSTLDYALKCAAHAACTAEAHSHRFGAWFLGDQPERYAMGGGPMHLLSFLDRMVSVKAQDDFAIEPWLAGLSPEVRNGATALLLLAASNVRIVALRDTLAEWRRRGVKMMVVLVNDRSFLKIYHEQQDMLKQAPPLHEQVHELLLAGCEVFTLGKLDDLTARLSRGEAMKR